MDILEPELGKEVFENAFVPLLRGGEAAPIKQMQRYLQKSAPPGRSDSGPVSYRFPDRFKHRLDVLINDWILESNDFYSPSLQKCSAVRLVLGSQLSEMERTVQFDGNVALQTEKVDNIATDAGLPAELLSEDLPSLKVLP